MQHIFLMPLAFKEDCLVKKYIVTFVTRYIMLEQETPKWSILTPMGLS